MPPNLGSDRRDSEVLFNGAGEQGGPAVKETIVRLEGLVLHHILHRAEEPASKARTLYLS